MSTNIIYLVGFISENQRRKIMKKLLTVLGVSFLLLLTWGFENEARAQATTKYLSVTPGAFRPINWDQMAVIMWVGTDDEFNFDTGAFGVFQAVAPVYLPHGSIIKKFTIFYTDNGTGSNDYFDASLSRRRLSTGSNGALATLTTKASPASSVRKSAAVSINKNNKVENSDHAYFITLFFHSGNINVKFNGAVIEYE
jgi:hypothetical protein